MKRLDIIRRAGRSLRQAKVRTLLTSLAIAVGAFTITLSLAAGAGSRSYANQLISSNVNPQSLFIEKDDSLFSAKTGSASSGLTPYDPDQTTRGAAKVTELTQSDIDTIAKQANVTTVTPIYQVSIKYAQFEGKDQKYTSEIGTYGDGILTNVSAGSLPAAGTQISDNDIIVPDSYLSQLGVSAQQIIGKKVTLTLERAAAQPTQDQLTQAFQTGGLAAIATLTKTQTKDFTYTVRAVTKPTATTLSATNSLVVSSNQSKAMAEYLTQGTDQYQKYIAATAIVKDGVDPATVKSALSAKGYTAQTAKDLESLIFTIVNILQDIVLGFGVVALIASVFGIINTQYISVLERTQQIGLMKALGMSGKDVAKLFRYEAAWIGFLGGLIGSLIAVVGGSLLNPWITSTLSLGDGNNLLIFQPIPIVIMIVALMLIAIIAGYFPARKAAKLDPIEALRTE